MAYEKNDLVAPVLKWVGGKRQLIPEITKLLPKKITKYYEPFLGGGALLFHIQPEKAVINDLNEELINCYNIIKKEPIKLIKSLKKHKNNSEYFYKIRELDRTNEYINLTDVEKASRIIYLNKTCFNGLFRVNSSGEFNSPFGKYKNPKIVDEITIKAMSDYFNNNHIEIYSTDYKKALKGIRKGNFVYFDPPYDPVSDSSNFTGYTKSGFSKQEQIELKKLCDQLNKKGIKFLLSNSATDFIKELYKEYYIESVNAKRNINSCKDGRGNIEELLIRNYEE
ncbi:DNA adenine methylase [Fusobacterium sp.]|uniref:DNA adenine methylase n=1 Tax=Fusobacterium sp. TaxID=68766 RepID=UPI002900FA15|nr:DNA adenine methylase [Fusobacterium sp.]MDU1911097.1 DNA adenine methylase [Fusobacterium sp.]